MTRPQRSLYEVSQKLHFVLFVSNNNNHGISLAFQRPLRQALSQGSCQRPQGMLFLRFRLLFSNLYNINNESVLLAVPITHTRLFPTLFPIRSVSMAPCIPDFRILFPLMCCSLLQGTQVAAVPVSRVSGARASVAVRSIISCFVPALPSPSDLSETPRVDALDEPINIMPYFLFRCPASSRAESHPSPPTHAPRTPTPTFF